MRRWWLAGLCAVAVGSAACGGGDDASTTTTAAAVTTTTAEVVVGRSYDIPSCAMAPTLQPGGRVVIAKPGLPARGDIVVYRQGENDHVARVVGGPGDHLEARDGRLVVNGAVVDEPYLAAKATTILRQPVDVAPDTWFLLGDNRTNSRDSRSFGGVPTNGIVGVAQVIARGDEEC